MEGRCSKDIFIHGTPEPRRNTSEHPPTQKSHYFNRRGLKLPTHMRTLCLPMTKETLRLHGLTKLDQLLSTVTYSPFLVKKRMEE